tara:strand:+ start:253 stop:768 length:516 start_codon:yes stop_codon:yes gene_type:complete
MSEIFDIPNDEPKREKKKMSPEAKNALMQRLREGRERAKARRNEILPPIDENVDNLDYHVDEHVDEQLNDEHLNNDDVRVLADEIEQLELKVNKFQKSEKKRNVNGLIKRAQTKREKYINQEVERKLNERTKPVKIPEVKIPVKIPEVIPVKKVSIFHNKVKPIWARGLDI